MEATTLGPTRRVIAYHGGIEGFTAASSLVVFAGFFGSAAAILSSSTIGSLLLPYQWRGLPVALPQIGLARQSEEVLGIRFWGMVLRRGGGVGLVVAVLARGREGAAVQIE